MQPRGTPAKETPMCNTPEFDLMIIEVEQSLGLEQTIELETLFRVLDGNPAPDARTR